MEHNTSQALDSIIQLPCNNKQPQTGHSSGMETEDHFIVRDGMEYAGSHIILDLWGARHLDNLEIYALWWHLWCGGSCRISH